MISKWKPMAARMVVRSNWEHAMHAFTKAVDSNPAVSVGVQTWSRGDIFPAVISRVETYDTPATYDEYVAANPHLVRHERHERFYRNYLRSFYERTFDERLIMTKFRLSMPGRDDQLLDTYDEAERIARSLLEYDAAVKRVAIDIANAKVARARASLVHHVRPSTTPWIGEVA